MRLGVLGALAISAAALTACSSGGTTPFNGTVTPPTGYQPTGVISIPGVPAPAPDSFGFDIGVVDNALGYYYLADRTTNGVDVFNTSTLQYVRTAGAGKFTGYGTKTSTPGKYVGNTGGPNGVLTTGGGIVFAGDGDSTLKVVDANAGTLLATIPLPNPNTTGTFPAAVCGTAAASPPTSGKGNLRADELAWDTTDNLILVINDASCPAYGTFVSSQAPYAVVGSISFPTALNGAEQPVWDPTQKLFIMAFPGTVPNPGGEIDLIDPIAKKIVSTLNTGQYGCHAQGETLGQGETLFIGCGGDGTTASQPLLTINAATFAVINNVPNYGGSDEVYYSAKSNRFFAASSNANTNGVNTPLLAITDGNGAFLQSYVTSAGAHSVAVDGNDRAYVPQRALGIQTYKL